MEKSLKRGFIFSALILFFGLMFVSGWISSETKYSNQGIQCEFNSSSAVWINISNISGVLEIVDSFVVFNSSGSVGNCSPRLSNLTNITCCPIGYQCNPVDGKCKIAIDDPCSSYTNQTSCLNANNIISGQNPAEKFFESKKSETGTNWRIGNKSIYEAKCSERASSLFVVGRKICGKLSDCVCSWSNNSCKAAYRDFTIFEDGKVLNETKCEYEALPPVNKCDTLGKIIIAYKVNSVPPGAMGCETPSQREIPCSAVVVVPFFTLSNLLVSILGIGLVYFLLRKKL